MSLFHGSLRVVSGHYQLPVRTHPFWKTINRRCVCIVRTVLHQHHPAVNRRHFCGFAYRALLCSLGCRWVPSLPTQIVRDMCTLGGEGADEQTRRCMVAVTRLHRSMVIISYPLPSFAERYRDASVHTHAHTHTLTVMFCGDESDCCCCAPEVFPLPALPSRTDSSTGTMYCC